MFDKIDHLVHISHGIIFGSNEFALFPASHQSDGTGVSEHAESTLPQTSTKSIGSLYIGPVICFFFRFYKSNIFVLLYAEK